MLKTRQDTSAFGCQKGIYKNVNKTPDMSGIFQIVNGRDIRLSDVTFMKNNVLISYKKGTTVTPGDIDVGEYLYSFPKRFMFYDEYWAKTKIPLNSDYDVDEAIYYLHDMNFVREDVKFYWGYQCRYF